MATWSFKSPSRLELLLLVQQLNEQRPAPSQQIAIDLTEDEKFRLKVLEEKQNSIKSNYNQVQRQASYMFPFLADLLVANSKIEIVDYDRDGFIEVTKHLLQAFEKEKLQDEAAKRAADKAKAMAQEARETDKLRQAAEKSYQEAVNNIETRKQLATPVTAGRARHGSTSTSSINTNYGVTSTTGLQVRPKGSPSGSNADKPQHGQGTGRVSKENTNTAALPEPEDLDSQTNAGESTSTDDRTRTDFDGETTKGTRSSCTSAF